MEMNESYRTVDKEIQKILKAEPAFKGTVLEGKERKYTVINEKDVQKYVPLPYRKQFDYYYSRICDMIEEGRKADEKKPYNSYIVINTDESYIKEITAVMEKHGHFNEDTKDTKVFDFDEDAEKWVDEQVDKYEDAVDRMVSGPHESKPGDDEF